MKPSKPAPDSGKGATRANENPNVQGEGDYEAARNYRKDVKDFLDSSDVDEAARAARPRNQKEEDEMRQAEQAGKSRAKEEDALLNKRKH